MNKYLYTISNDQLEALNKTLEDYNKRVQTDWVDSFIYGMGPASVWWPIPTSEPDSEPSTLEQSLRLPPKANLPKMEAPPKVLLKPDPFEVYNEKYNLEEP